MPGVAVAVQPDVLDWVMQKASSLDIGSEMVQQMEKWRSGEKTPTFHQLEEISRKTGIPFGYFFLQDPPKETCEITEFRTIDSVLVSDPSRELVDTIDAMTDVQQWMADYNRENGKEPCPYVGRARKTTNVKSTAADIRKALNIEDTWFTNYRNPENAFRMLRTKIGDLGVLVMLNGVVGNNTHRRLNAEEFRAFTLNNEYAPLIFINTTDSANGKLFSLFHELSHVWIGESSFYNDRCGAMGGRSKEERFCNAVAAEILVPDSLFTSKWKEQNGSYEEIIDQLSEFFLCSKFVLARKALDHGFITKEEYTGLVGKYTKAFKDCPEEKKKGGGDYYRSLKAKWDSNFIKALSESTENGHMQYRDAYLLTNTTGKTFAVLAENVGGYEIG